MLSVKIPDARPVVNKYKQDLDVARMRTVNAVSEKAKNWLARKVAQTYGWTVGTVKRRLKIVKATLGNSVALLQVSGKRLGYPGLRRVKRKRRAAGISFYSEQKSIRKKIVEPIEHFGQLGSKPFIIKGKHSGKPIAVFVDPAFLDKKSNRVAGGSHPRKVITMAGHSLPHVLKEGWNEEVVDQCRREIPREMDRQLAYLNTKRR